MQDLVDTGGAQPSGCRDRADARSCGVSFDDRRVSGCQRKSRLVGGPGDLRKVCGGHETSARPFWSEERKISSTSLQRSVPASQSSIARRTFGVLNSEAKSLQTFSEADISAPFVVGEVVKSTSTNLDCSGAYVKQTEQNYTKG